MFPYKTRTQWFLFGRYAHLVMALRGRKAGKRDRVVEARLASIARWNRLRFGLALILSFGILAAMAGWIGRQLPSFQPAEKLLGSIAATSSAFAGFLSILFLLVSRVLAQLEADVLSRLLSNVSEK